MDEERKRIQDLINNLSENRKPLFDMLKDLEGFRKKLDLFLPKDTKDFRNRFAQEERIKSVTNIFRAELDVRKYIDNSIGAEVNMLRKSDGSEDDISDARNTIEALAAVLEKQMIEKEELKKK
jgi:hypothetical protein